MSISSSGNIGDPIKNEVAACPAGTDLPGLGARLRRCVTAEENGESPGLDLARLEKLFLSLA